MTDVATPEPSPPVHVCIATGQNAANLIPLEQYDAREVWILQTQAMKESAKQLALALKKRGRHIERIDFDDASPDRLTRSAEWIAERLDGRHVVLHVTGGTKLMVLALRDGLRLVESGAGSLDILYAETLKQQIDWLGAKPRTEPMADVLNLQKMLLVQGYRIDGDSRHSAALKRATAPDRARTTRMLGERAGRHGAFLTPLATLGNRAAEGQGAEGGLVQHFTYQPGGPAADLLRDATEAGLLTWDGDIRLRFADLEVAGYFAGGWLEEFVLLKLSGMAPPDRFASNLVVRSAAHDVPNELDAMLVHRNRALLIECKTGRQNDPADALYKLAQLRDRLGGSVASALYLSAQPLGDAHRKRAADYRVAVLCGHEVAKLPAWLQNWMDG